MSSNTINLSDFVRRKTAKQLAYRSRHLAITSHEQVESRRVRKYLLYCLALGKKHPKLKKLFNFFTIRYLSLHFRVPEPISKPIRRIVTLDSFSPSQCYIFFKFRKSDLSLLLNLLRFDAEEEMKLSNNGSMSGEEIFLRGLYELCTGANQQIMCETLFGREQSQQSRAFSKFINHIFDNFAHLLKSSLPWWYRNGFFTSSAEAFKQKFIELGWPQDLDLPFLYSHEVDCNCLETSTPGGGPAEDGANAARFDESVQRAFYNGWKSIHGLKHQTSKNLTYLHVC